MHYPVFEHLDTLSFAFLVCMILFIDGKQFRCSVFTFVQYMYMYFLYYSVPIGIPQRVYAEPFNESALTVYWKPVPDTRDFMKGRLKGYKVSFQSFIR